MDMIYIGISPVTKLNDIIFLNPIKQKHFTSGSTQRILINEDSYA